MQFAFRGSPLNRRSDLRNKPDGLEARRLKADSVLLFIRGDGVLLHDGELHLDHPAKCAEAIFLGEDSSGKSWFAAEAELDLPLEGLRALMLAEHLGPERLAILAQARSLVHWHESHKFCARCGNPSEMRDGGYRRNCPTCGADHFPRTDPVVIMSVICGQELLLGRQSSWPQGMYSTLAGFMEPGEAIEEAVAREVFEESGVKVKAVHYLTSQPWPFPSSLMIGALAETDDPKLTIDTSELETARWFAADELRQMLDGTHPRGLSAPRPYAIARHLIEAALQTLDGR